VGVKRVDEVRVLKRGERSFYFSACLLIIGLVIGTPNWRNNFMALHDRYSSQTLVRAAMSGSRTSLDSLPPEVSSSTYLQTDPVRSCSKSTCWLKIPTYPMSRRPPTPSSRPPTLPHTTQRPTYWTYTRVSSLILS
jgi:hypothetical protein